MVGSAAQYWRLAQECLELAQTAPLRDRPVLREIANAWQELARGAEQIEAMRTGLFRGRSSPETERLH